MHSPELVLDLFSVEVGGKEYRIDTSDVDMSSKRGIGKQAPTDIRGRWGWLWRAAGRCVWRRGGAGIGAAAGAGAGLLTQILTRGKQVKVPAETAMRFRLDRTLVLKARMQC